MNEHEKEIYMKFHEYVRDDHRTIKAAQRLLEGGTDRQDIVKVSLAAKQEAQKSIRELMNLMERYCYRQVAA